jgi:hypothetical protein
MSDDERPRPDYRQMLRDAIARAEGADAAMEPAAIHMSGEWDGGPAGEWNSFMAAHSFVEAARIKGWSKAAIVAFGRALLEVVPDPDKGRGPK